MSKFTPDVNYENDWFLNLLLLHMFWLGPQKCQQRHFLIITLPWSSSPGRNTGKHPWQEMCKVFPECVLHLGQAEKSKIREWSTLAKKDLIHIIRYILWLFPNSVHLLSWTWKSHSFQKSCKTFARELNQRDCVWVVMGLHKTLVTVLVPVISLFHKRFWFV